MRLPSGHMKGRYRVEDYISEGGMQQVYRATDTLLEREVALKIPKNDDGERRFDRSARNSAKVSHSNVARTLDFFEEEGNRYLVEELVEGQDLGEILKRVTQLDPYITAQMFHGLARGLAAVHAVGVVHRDLKPSNVMVKGGLCVNDVKITDFGVAKMAAAEIDAGLGGLNLTGSKTLIGHLPYMAPEIIRKRTTVDQRCDIWSVGALTYHLLAGEPPFGTELGDVERILREPVPELPDAVDKRPQLRVLGREIHGIIVACLQRDPALRPTALQLVKLCERLCYPVIQREVGVVSGYPGGSFGFVEAERGTVFFHVESVFGLSRPRVGGKVWFARHKGDPRDRAHPVVPLLPQVSS